MNIQIILSVVVLLAWTVVGGAYLYLLWQALAGWRKANMIAMTAANKRKKKKAYWTVALSTIGYVAGLVLLAIWINLSFGN